MATMPENIDPHDALAILEVARRLGVSSDLDELLDLIINGTTKVLDCERASLFLYDAERDDLYTKVATGLGMIRLPLDRGFTGACARDRRVINIPDAYADPRFNRQIDRQTGYRTRSILTTPLISYEGDLVGVLQAINKRDRPFDGNDEWLLETLGSQAAVALQRARLLQAYADKQRLEHELDLAREIQEALLPKAVPQLPGYQIVGWNRPAEQTGGDCYDFIEFENQRVGIILADASGHGIAPALVVAQLRAMLRALLSGKTVVESPLISKVNDILCRDLPADRFVTAFCGILDRQTNELVYCSPGQGPILHVRPSSGKVEQFNASACPLGILPDQEFHPADPISLAPRDVVLLVTDGFFEWANARSEQFGLNRLTDLALRLADHDAEEILFRIREEVVHFSGGTKQQDDLTAIVIKRMD